MPFDPSAYVVIPMLGNGTPVLRGPSPAKRLADVLAAADAFQRHAGVDDIGVAIRTREGAFPDPMRWIAAGLRDRAARTVIAARAHRKTPSVHAHREALLVLWLIWEADRALHDHIRGWPRDVRAPAGFGFHWFDQETPPMVGGVPREFAGLPVLPRPLHPAPRKRRTV